MMKVHKIISIVGVSIVFTAIILSHTVATTGWIRFWDNIHWTFAYATAAYWAWLGTRNAEADALSVRKWSAIGLTAYFIGQVLWDIQVAIEWNPFPGPSDFFFLLLGPSIAVGLSLSIRSRLSPNIKKTVILDTLALSIAVIAITLAWYIPRQGTNTDIQLLVMVLYPVLLLTPASIGIILLLTFRYNRSKELMVFLLMLVAHGAIWMQWNSLTLDNALADGLWFNSTFSVIALIFGWSITNVQFSISKSLRWERFCEGLLRLLPIIVVLLSALSVILVFGVANVPQSIQYSIGLCALLITSIAIFRQNLLLMERDRLLEAERRAYESEQRFQLLAKNAPEIVYLQANDEQGTILFINNAVEKFTGYAAKQFIERSITFGALCHPEDKSRVQAAVLECLSAKMPFHIEYRIFDKNGNVHWFEEYGDFIQNEENTQYSEYIVGIILDVSDRKAAEERLIEVQHFNQRVTQTVPGVLYLSHLFKGGVSFLNRNLFDELGFFGEKFEEIKTDPLRKLIHPDDYDSVVSTSEKFYQSTEDVTEEAEYRIKNARGEYRWFHAWETAFSRNKDGKMDQILGILQDVSDRRAREEEVRQKNDEMTRFIYTVSHDLKSPLVTISTFLGYLEQDIVKQDAARISKDLGYIRNASQKMAKLLDELLELSRIGRKVNPLEHVPLQDIVSEALNLVAGRIALRGVSVVVTPKPISLFCDRRRFVEVFQNLLDNAVKFMGTQENPLIEIGFTESGEGGNIIVFVKDNGAGIDPRYIAKVFGLFEKLHADIDGTGIGLALVHRIIEVHSGKIWVESEGLGRGTTFFFTIEGIRFAED